MKVYGYIRVSTEMQKETGYGLETQVRSIKDHCKKNNFELIRVFRDEGISGTEFDDRPALQELLGSFTTEIQHVVIFKTDRLWRDDVAKALIKRSLFKRNAHIISVDQPEYSIYDKEPNNFLMNSMMELLDQYERLTINSKLLSGRRTKANSGVKGCGTAPLGYLWSHEGSKPVLVKDQKTAKIVMEIFEQYPKLKSLEKVRKYLESRNYRTSQDKSFSTMGINLILKNRFYTGDLIWGGVEVKGQHEMLVNKIVFGRVQGLLDRNNKKKQTTGTKI